MPVLFCHAVTGRWSSLPHEEGWIVVLRKTWAIAVLIMFSMGTGPAAAQLDWEVLSSSAQQMEVRLTVRGAEWMRAGTDPSGSPWYLVEIDGAHQSGSPGLPMLPRAARWFALPPEGEASIDFEILGRQVLGRGRMLPHSTPSIDPQAMDDEPRLVERSIEGPGYNRFSTTAAEAVSLGQAVFHRRQRVAPLRVSPVFYDAATGRVEVATEIRVRVRFPQPAGRHSPVKPGLQRFQSSLLNGELAREWGCLPPELEGRKKIWASDGLDSGLRRAAVWGTPLFDKSRLRSAEIRLRVSGTGLHRVQMSTLLTNHELPPSTLRRDLRLYQKRRDSPDSPTYPTPITADVPLYFVGDPDPNSPVDPADVIVFYGFSAQDDWVDRNIDGANFPRAMTLPSMRPDSYNSANVYFLAAMDPAGGAWARMPVETLGPSQGSPQSMFRKTRTFTGDAAFQQNPKDPTVERYHWNDWDEVNVQRAVPVFAAVPDSNVRWAWTVTSRSMNTNVPHPVDFYLEGLNGRIDLMTINSDLALYRVLHELRAEVPASALPDGFVRLGMDHVLNGSSARVGTYLGRITVDYASMYRAAFSDLEFSTGATGVNVDIEATGFDRGDLLLFEVTDPRRPRAITLSPQNVVDAGDGTFTLSLHVPQVAGEQRSFRASPLIRLDVLRNQDIETDNIPSVFDTANDLQVLAVGPAVFADKMQSWVQWRQDHDLGYGWRVGYVDVQQIYDDFSGGLQSPEAIHDFVEYAYVSWGAEALLLVGYANEDARQITSDAGPNLVPARVHLQQFLGVTELLASDKWYAFMNPRADFPDRIDRTADLLVGRLPVADNEGLQVALDKIFAYEQPRASDDWRRRSYWIADDAYSSNYLGTSQGTYGFVSDEVEFGRSQERSANLISTSLDTLQSGIYFNLDEVTSGCRDELGCTTAPCVASCYANRGQGRLFEVLSQGWLMVSYQGHAAFNRLAHETMVNRNALGALQNVGKPFLFFGMGCHVSDFLQAEEGRVGTPIGEYLFALPGKGAIATYGSSGFEFLNPNATFMEEIASVFWAEGRSTGQLSSPLASQWVVGEALAQAELNTVGISSVFRKSEMIAQYNLLGDPLLRMDAAPPRLRVWNSGGALSEGADLVADAGATTASLRLEAIDETGISRLEIVDSQGRDSTGLLQPLAGTDPRRRSYDLNLPILPQTYDVEISIHDGSYPDTRPTRKTWHVTLGHEIYVDGSLFDPAAGSGFPVGQTIAVEVRLSSPVDLQNSDFGAVTLDGGTVGPVTVTGSGRDWTLIFDARAEVSTGQVLSLSLGSATETIPLSAGTVGGAPLVIEAHYPMPNPARLAGGQPIYVVARASEAVEWARLTVYDLSGRMVYERRDDGLSLGSGELSLAWDGRTSDGSEIANGTYFYRLEVGAGTRAARSNMGRIVVMR